MDRLEIDEGIKDLIKQMWKHNYRTVVSCEGHPSGRSVAFMENTGDGWFEELAVKYGLEKERSKECCISAPAIDKFCRICGAGVNGVAAYDIRISREFEDIIYENFL